MIVIIDYGMGNCGSMQNMIKKSGYKAIISGKQEDIELATTLILPGVGAFDNAMKKLTESGLIDIIQKKVLIDKVRFLGVCLGMQLLFSHSEEGNHSGLGWLEGSVERFSFSSPEYLSLKIPHMGWNEITSPNSSFIFAQMEQPRFYFVHSFHVNCPKEYVIGEAIYGYNFVCAVNKENIFGAQFHPEKSHKFGLQFFKNFLGETC